MSWDSHPTCVCAHEQEERAYIEATTHHGRRKRTLPSPPSASSSPSARATPYLKMMASRPFWALQAAVCGYAWVAYVMLTLTPSYLHNIQDVPYSMVCPPHRPS